MFRHGTWRLHYKKFIGILLTAFDITSEIIIGTIFVFRSYSEV